MRILIVLLLVVSILQARTNSYVRGYVYHATSSDSKATANAIAEHQIKQLMIEEVGVFVQNTENQKIEDILQWYTNESVQLAAGVQIGDKLEESWNGSIYRLKVEVHVDLEKLEKELRTFLEDSVMVNRMEKSRADEKAIVQEREKLLAQLDSTLAIPKVENKSGKVPFEDRVRATRFYNKTQETTDLDEKLKYISLSLSFDPYYSTRWYSRYKLYRKKGDYFKAMEDLTMAIEVDSTYESAWYSRANLSNVLNDYTQGLHDIEKFLELDTTKAYGYLEKGDVLKSLKRYEEAESVYNTILKKWPDNGDAMIELGRIYTEQKMYKKALRIYNKGVEQGGDNVMYYLGIGLCYEELGKFDKAIQSYVQAQFESRDNRYISAALREVRLKKALEEYN